MDANTMALGRGLEFGRNGQMSQLSQRLFADTRERVVNSE